MNLRSSTNNIPWTDSENFDEVLFDVPFLISSEKTLDEQLENPFGSSEDSSTSNEISNEPAEKIPEAETPAKKRFQTGNHARLADKARYMREYRKKNAARINEINRRYREKHKEDAKANRRKYEYDKKYRENHRERVNEIIRNSRKKNPEKYKMQWKKYRETHPEEIRAARQKYDRANRDRINAANRERRKRKRAQLEEAEDD